jgi:hypothetical protein
MGAEQVWVQPDAGNPLRYTPSVLPRSHTPLLPSAGCEHEFAGLLTGRPDVVVHCLTSLFRQFEPDRPPGLFLAYGRSIARITIRRNVFDLESDDIAASQLAVDGQIEHREIARSLLDLELGPDRPDVLLPQGRLGPYQLSLVPGYPLECGSLGIGVVLHGRTPRLQRRTRLPCEPEDVRFEGIGVISRFSCEMARWLVTHYDKLRP